MTEHKDQTGEEVLYEAALREFGDFHNATGEPGTTLKIAVRRAVRNVVDLLSTETHSALAQTYHYTGGLFYWTPLSAAPTEAAQKGEVEHKAKLYDEIVEQLEANGYQHFASIGVAHHVFVPCQCKAEGKKEDKKEDQKI